LAAAPSRAPLAELAAGERPLERAVELLRLKRFAKELEPTLCGEAYLVVAPRDHDDWKSKVFRMTSKRRAVLSRRYGIDDDRVNPAISPQKIAHGRAGWHSTDAVAAVLKYVGYQFSHGVVIFHEKNVLGLGLPMTASRRL
jgi:hypothetical protein